MADIIMNGKHYKGRNISVRNGTIIIDGKKVTDPPEPDRFLEIEVKGGLASLECDGDVTCQNVEGTVQAGGDVDCDNVGGTVQAGGDVECGKVGGSVMAGGDVTVH